MYTRQLNLKYPLPNGRVGRVREDHAISQECYLKKLEVTMDPLTPAVIPRPVMDDAYNVSWDPRLGEESERLTQTEALKEVQIGPMHLQVTKLARHLVV